MGRVTGVPPELPLPLHLRSDAIQSLCESIAGPLGSPEQSFHPLVGCQITQHSRWKLVVEKEKQYRQARLPLVLRSTARENRIKTAEWVSFTPRSLLSLVAPFK